MARTAPQSTQVTPLARSFYDRDVVTVARALLGKLLVRTVRGRRTSGRIVEVEAYLAEGDSACHSFRGRRPRNAAMFGPPGCAYVYSIHARYCMNVVTEPAGVASAVLIRAIEPIEGVASMERRRGTEARRDLARGPARLCAALAIDRTLDGHDLTCGDSLWIAGGPDPDGVVTTRRIGVTSAKELPLRFLVAGSRFVSGTRRQNEPAV